MHRGVDHQMPSPPSGGLSLLRLAWRHVARERESSAGVALALFLALLPAGLLVVESSGARSDLQDVVAASDGVTVQRAGVADANAFDAFQRHANGEVAPRLGQYLDGGSERASAGPFRLDSIAAGATSGPAATAQVTVAYVADLAAHVRVTQGLLARRAPQGGEETVSMPQALADRAGVRLFDQVCIRPAPQTTSAEPWCARVVGIWRPSGGADSRWTAAGAPIQLFTGRDQLFSLTGRLPSPSVTAARQFRPRAASIALQDATAVADRVRETRASIAAARADQVRTTLDAELDRYTAARHVDSFPVWLLAAALIPLSALLAGVLGRWYVELRLHDLALLRARGWSVARVERLVLAQFAIVGASALAVAVVGVPALALRAGNGAIDVGPISPGQGDLLGVAVAVAVPVLAAGAWLTWLARWASRQTVLRLEHPESRPVRVPTWRGADVSGLLVLPAALLLLLPHLAGTERWLGPGAPDDLGALLVSVAGLVMLAAAALPAMSLAAEARGAQRSDVEATLARWQLRRWWHRHAAEGFAVVLSFAVASFAAVAFAYQELGQSAAGASALGQGVAGGLAIGFVCSMVAALLAYGLVFLFACRSRTDDYAALLVDGLPAASVRRSLQIEQHAVLAVGLLVGLALGLLLAWSNSPGTGSGGAIAGLLATAAIGLGAGLTVARYVRRSAVGFRLVEQARRTT
jgi:hypothetical protein